MKYTFFCPLCVRRTPVFLVAVSALGCRAPARGGLATFSFQLPGPALEEGSWFWRRAARTAFAELARFSAAGAGAKKCDDELWRRRRSNAPS